MTDDSQFGNPRPKIICLVVAAIGLSFAWHVLEMKEFFPFINGQTPFFDAITKRRKQQVELVCSM